MAWHAVAGKAAQPGSLQPRHCHERDSDAPQHGVLAQIGPTVDHVDLNLSSHINHALRTFFFHLYFYLIRCHFSDAGPSSEPTVMDLTYHEHVHCTLPAAQIPQSHCVVFACTATVME